MGDSESVLVLLRPVCVCTGVCIWVNENATPCLLGIKLLKQNVHQLGSTASFIL